MRTPLLILLLTVVVQCEWSLRGFETNGLPTLITRSMRALGDKLNNFTTYINHNVDSMIEGVSSQFWHDYEGNNTSFISNNNNPLIQGNRLVRSAEEDDLAARKNEYDEAEKSVARAKNDSDEARQNHEKTCKEKDEANLRADKAVIAFAKATVARETATTDEQKSKYELTTAETDFINKKETFEDNEREFATPVQHLKEKTDKLEANQRAYDTALGEYNISIKASDDHEQKKKDEEDVIAEFERELPKKESVLTKAAKKKEKYEKDQQEYARIKLLYEEKEAFVSKIGDLQKKLEEADDKRNKAKEIHERLIKNPIVNWEIGKTENWEGKTVEEALVVWKEKGQKAKTEFEKLLKDRKSAATAKAVKRSQKEVAKPKTNSTTTAQPPETTTDPWPELIQSANETKIKADQFVQALTELLEFFPKELVENLYDAKKNYGARMIFEEASANAQQAYRFAEKDIANNEAAIKRKDRAINGANLQELEKAKNTAEINLGIIKQKILDLTSEVNTLKEKIQDSKQKKKKLDQITKFSTDLEEKETAMRTAEFNLMLANDSYTSAKTAHDNMYSLTLIPSKNKMTSANAFYIKAQDAYKATSGILGEAQTSYANAKRENEEADKENKTWTEVCKVALDVLHAKKSAVLDRKEDVEKAKDKVNAAQASVDAKIAKKETEEREHQAMIGRLTIGLSTTGGLIAIIIAGIVLGIFLCRRSKAKQERIQKAIMPEYHKQDDGLTCVDYKSEQPPNKAIVPADECGHRPSFPANDYKPEYFKKENIGVLELIPVKDAEKKPDKLTFGTHHEFVEKDYWLDKPFIEVPDRPDKKLPDEDDTWKSMKEREEKVIAECGNTKSEPTKMPKMKPKPKSTNTNSNSNSKSRSRSKEKDSAATQSSNPSSENGDKLSKGRKNKAKSTEKKK